MATNCAGKNSTPAVVILLVILAGAIGVTFVRLNPKNMRSAAKPEQPAVAARTGSGSVTVAPVLGLSRNPFRKPDAFRNVAKSAPAGIDVVVQSPGKVAPATGFQLEAVPIGKLPSPSDAVTLDKQESADTQAENAQKPAQPEFALLATVAGAGGISAVIRNGGSNTTVIEVGDVVDGGYTVQKIEKDQAVLKNGVDIVVVKRPD